MPILLAIMVSCRHKGCSCRGISTPLSTNLKEIKPENRPGSPRMLIDR